MSRISDDRKRAFAFAAWAALAELSKAHLGRECEFAAVVNVGLEGDLLTSMLISNLPTKDVTYGMLAAHMLGDEEFSELEITEILKAAGTKPQ